MTKHFWINVLLTMLDYIPGLQRFALLLTTRIVNACFLKRGLLE